MFNFSANNLHFTTHFFGYKTAQKIVISTYKNFTTV